MVVVLQMADPDNQTVSASPYQSLKLLKPLIKLVRPDAFDRVCQMAKLKKIEHEIITLKSNKSFYVAAYKNGTIIVSEAKTVAVLRDPSGELYMFCRKTRRGNLSLVGQENAAKGPYVKLVRNGDVFTGYCSADEETWTEIGQVTLSLSERVEMGMAVCSGDPAALAKATFSEFSRIESPSIADQRQ